jgi:hypothetical protein
MCENSFFFQEGNFLNYVKNVARICEKTQKRKNHIMEQNYCEHVKNILNILFLFFSPHSHTKHVNVCSKDQHYV